MRTKLMSRIWCISRITFRWCRIFFLMAVLCLVVATIYLNTIGLPDFLKRPLLARLREQGIEVQFSRMRLRWYRGIVVNNPVFTRTNQLDTLKFSAVETEINLNWGLLKKSQFQLDALAVKDGKFIWPVSKTNQVVVGKIQANLHFASSNILEVKQLEATALGIEFAARGTLTNFSDIKDWSIFKKKKPSGKPPGTNKLETLFATWNQIRFSKPPKLDFMIRGDASQPEKLQSHLEITVPKAESAWGTIDTLRLAAELNEKAPDSRIVVHAVASEISTIWGRGRYLKLLSRTSLSAQITNQFNAKTLFSVQDFQADWGKPSPSNSFSADTIYWNGTTTFSVTNRRPEMISGKLNLTKVAGHFSDTNHFTTENVELDLSASRLSAEMLVASDSSWAQWQKLKPFTFNWAARLTNASFQKNNAQTVDCSGKWLAPMLTLEKLKAKIFDGTVRANGDLNIASRQLTASTDIDIDPHNIETLLNSEVQEWLKKVTGKEPPKLTLNAQAILPAWTNRAPEWKAEVLPTLEAKGNATWEKVTFRNVTASLKTEFTYTNRILTVPLFQMNHPDGQVDLSLVSNDRTAEFHGNINSQIAPATFRPMLEQSQLEYFDYVKFTNTPHILIEVTGRWGDWKTLDAKGEISATNLAYRALSMDRFHTAFSFTNNNLELTKFQVEQDVREIRSPYLKVDFNTEKIYFTNVFSTMDPHLVTRQIGRAVFEAVEPYRFVVPPTVHLNGVIDANDIAKDEMHFVVEGKAFQWEWFNADKVSGNVDWLGETLFINNVKASGYNGGEVEGHANFDFRPRGVAYQFDFTATNIDAKNFFQSIQKTNHLEGRLSGQLTITSANTTNLNTWQGHGNINLMDGLIWETPIFGIFSPMLDSISPGAGKNRAREATGSFTISNSVIHTEDLSIRASGLRLQYRGDIDFDRKVNARVEAEVLRDAWLVGRVVSLAFMPFTKLFEYKVSGLLENPQMEPVYIPKFLIRPFHSIKSVFTEKKETEEKPPEEPAKPDK